MQDWSSFLINLLPAAVMAIFTITAAWAIIYIMFFKKKVSGAEFDTKKKSDGYADCELNKIMGYDFIQIKEIDKETETGLSNKQAEPNPDMTEEEGMVNDFSKSRGLGVTETLHTISAEDDYNDYPEDPAFETDDNNVPQEGYDRDEEDGKSDDENNEGMTEISQDMMIDMMSDENWPTSSIPDESRDDFMNYMYSNIKEDIIEDNDAEKPSITEPTKEEASYYEDRENINNLMEKLQSMNDENYLTPEQEEAFSNISMLSSKQKKS